MTKKLSRRRRDVSIVKKLYQRWYFEAFLKLLEAFYKVAYQVAIKKKPDYNHHRISEALCAERSHDHSEEKYKNDGGSNCNNIKNRIVDVSHDILEQVIHDIKVKPMKTSSQMNDFTDIAHCSKVFTVIWYVKNEEVLEDILFCEPLKIN